MTTEETDKFFKTVKRLHVSHGVIYASEIIMTAEMLYLYNLHSNVRYGHELKDAIDNCNVCIVHFDLFDGGVNTKQIRK